VPLNPGWNVLRFIAEDTTGRQEDSLRVYRVPPPQTLPETPTTVDPTTLEPKADVSLLPGDYLEVRFRGSPGGTGTFEIKKLLKNVPMTELPPPEAQGLRGVYYGIARLPSKEKFKPVPVIFKLKGQDGKTVKAESNGKLSLLSETVPLIAETMPDTTTLLRSALPGGAIVAALVGGVRLQVVGRLGEMYKVRLAEGVTAYAPVSLLRTLPSGTPLPRATVGGISSAIVGDWVRLQIAIDRRVPYRIEQSLEPPALELTLYGAHQGSEWTTYPANDTTIQLIQWSQPAEEIYKLRVLLNQKQQWGFDLRYVGTQLWLEIRRSPKFALPPASPVAGLTFAVDPGHGGKELGAVGATGVQEKDLNLKYATRLAELLETAGAKVVMTRRDDRTMTLAERVKIAREANALIYVWCHNNSIGEATDPLAVRGTSTYYTVPQAQAIAWEVYPWLLRQGLEPFGEIASTYFVTRQTAMVTFLVEGAFLSHPEDEMLLMDDRFLDCLAGAVFSGIEEFLKERRQEQLRGRSQ